MESAQLTQMEVNNTKIPPTEAGNRGLVFAVNGEKFEVAITDHSTTLLQFLRSHTRFKSPKLGCGEGFSLNCLDIICLWRDIFFCFCIFHELLNSIFVLVCSLLRIVELF